MTGDRMIDAGMIGGAGSCLAHDLALAWLNQTLAWPDLCVPHLE